MLNQVQHDQARLIIPADCANFSADLRRFYESLSAEISFYIGGICGKPDSVEENEME